MSLFVRSRRVSDPLDERVKARLLSGYASGSGSDHDTSCVALSGLVRAFLDLGESATCATAEGAGSDCECWDHEDLPSIQAAKMVQDLLHRGSDDHLRSVVAKAAEAASGCNIRREVMARLRGQGYDAGICKVKWGTSGGMTAGSYEYVDVVTCGGERYIVDLDFRAQFEVARATAGYGRLVATLPSVMVGRAEEVRRVVRAAAKAANRSLKSKGLSVPPWRKRRYVVNKWFGSYQRVFEASPAGGATVGTGGRGEVIQCRAVGFGVENLRGGGSLFSD